MSTLVEPLEPAAGLRPAEATDHTFTSFDGQELFYRAWMPAETPRRFVLLFHRGHEHSGRWQATVEALRLRDCALFAWDQRGHGRSPGPRGHAPSLMAIEKDADAWVRHLAAAHGLRIAETAVVASSVGAVVAAAWVHDFGPPVRGMVLAAPAFRVKLYVPLAVPGLRALAMARPRAEVKSYVKAHMLTHDAAEAAAHRADPLIFRQIAVNMLLDLHDGGTRLVEDAGAIETPTLVLAGGRDWVVKTAPQRRFFERLGSPVKQMEFYPGAYHALFQETCRDEVIGRTRQFLEECFARPAAPGRIDADRGSASRTQYDALRVPGSRAWGALRGLMHAVSWPSDGFRTGCRTGFDSGASLDYVYRNRAHGITPLGTLIDRIYLQAIGWRGIRARRAALGAMLRRAMAQCTPPVHLLDIAAGHGRYVLETLRTLPAASVRLRDIAPANVDAARRLAAELGVPGVVAETGDAFDEESLARITPRPTVAIVSGLYELFADNAPVLASLRGLAAAMPAGALLIYTNQPWHPQIEFIARTLRNREGVPWIMRRRSQAEMDALVRAAGFEKLEQDMDPWGIFSVSLARRVRA